MRKMKIPWKVLGITIVFLVLFIPFAITPMFTHNVLLKFQTDHPKQSNRSLRNRSSDSVQNITTKIIYEPGHIDVSATICPELGKYLQLVIIITSAADAHESARMAIRHTWGQFSSRKQVAVAFILGTTEGTTYNLESRDRIEKEQLVYKDIISGKFIDTYENLTLKTVSMLEFVKNYCPKPHFVLKTDDDMYINVPLLLTFVAEQNTTTRGIYGRLARNWITPREKKSKKYYISPNQYKPRTLPDFTTGPAYLFPANLAEDLYVAALAHRYFKLEDVFLTGMVANQLRIKRFNIPQFVNEPLSHSAYTPWNICVSIGIHSVNRTQQYDLWNKGIKLTCMYID